MTPVARLAQYIRERHETNESFENMVANLQQIEKDNIKRAVLYSLDEDGHTGDWKLAFAEKYYLDNYPVIEATPKISSPVETWEEIQEEYLKDEYPVFGGPFTDALTIWEWLEIYYQPPVRKSESPH